MKQLLTGVLCVCLLSWGHASGQAQPDSIITTKGAVTLITCGSSISTFQIGDGKNSDYDYRIVDGNVVFIRPVVANPRPTNLVIREGDNIFYMILAYREKVGLSKLKYNLSGGASASRTSTGAQNTTGGTSSTANTSDPAADDNTPVPDVDTVTVGNIAADFIKQRKVQRQYETTSESITVTFSQAMSLNNLMYLCFRIKNQSGTPYQVGKITIMHKVYTDTATLHHLPVAYKKGPSFFGGRDEKNVVFVTPAPVLKKADELIFIMYNAATKSQIVLYVPMTGLPKYMVTK
ncbi:hypothetical protein [Chitinophaga sancti]|uniref:DUF4138 domain-containing protein n=1 Tax=Chitinophaga sancti TaxID=1004 RepID=A0A1K1QTM7_9BACT|nr:hypothetical protein [Chitinophaga sancti]WQD61903.1 hypothetical protein U0033_28875 [Chitinophaga sancti]WQG92528.1 hypothetical protein SR876_13510 [Chitinophaga sancti]SFW63052.1 hypothetical protein SAMN05661012_03036 [Chitinophaga sancti]